MTTPIRCLLAAALLSLLAACGNKGALIKPSQIPPPSTGESMPVPPDTNPVDPAPLEQSTVPATDAPAVPADAADDNGDDSGG